MPKPPQCPVSLVRSRHREEDIDSLGLGHQLQHNSSPPMILLPLLLLHHDLRDHMQRSPAQQLNQDPHQPEPQLLRPPPQQWQSMWMQTTTMQVLTA
jgi:hypothetical protein